MIYNHARRLVVQESGGTAQYVLPVISANADASYPFTVSTANIKIISGNGIYDYISNVNPDDIVRLQVSNTHFTNEADVWQDIFEGRILDVSTNFGQGNTADIACAGHEYATSYADIPMNYAVSATDAGAISQNWNYMTNRIQVAVPVTPTFSMNYSVAEDKKFLKDVFRDVEDASGYTYYYQPAPKYDSALNLTPQTNINFQHVPTTPTTSYSVTQGSIGLLYANFTVSSKEIYNHIIYYGDANGTSVSSDSDDIPSQTKYDVRTYVGNDTSLNTAVVCAQFAEGLLAIYKDVQMSGTAVIMGTPAAKVCDLVPIRIGDIDVNGASLSTNLRAVRVTHELTEDNYLTTLQFGRSQMSPEDYIGEFARLHKLVNKMLI